MGHRVLVTTAYCGEAEFDMSKRSVTEQVVVQIEHKIFKHYPELEAHNVILKQFREYADDYDMYVKVDADTIITHENMFIDVLKFLQSTNYAAVQLYLHDYFTNKNINGLNFYHPQRNSFNESRDRLYTDRSIVHYGPVAYSEQLPHLIPAGYHCLFPHDSQSFHYGYHRGLKNKTQNESDVREAYVMFNDRQREIALLGFEASRVNKGEHEYSAANFQQLMHDAIAKANERRK